MALMGDAISHGILPGLVISFLICGSLEIGPMLVGACMAGVFCSFCIEWLRHNTEIKQDASMAIVFTTFFAFGVTLINLQTGHLDLDTSCVLYGEIGLTPLATDWIIAGFKLGNRSHMAYGLYLRDNPDFSFYFTDSYCSPVLTPSLPAQLVGP